MELITLGQTKMIEEATQNTTKDFLNTCKINNTLHKKNSTKNIKKNCSEKNTKNLKKNSKNQKKVINKNVINNRKELICSLLEKYKEFAIMKNSYFEKYIDIFHKKFVIKSFTIFFTKILVYKINKYKVFLSQKFQIFY